MTVTADNERSDELEAWAATTVNQDSIELRRLPGGGRHEAWEVVAADGKRWFLRADSQAPGDHEHYTLRREAEIYSAAGQTGIPVPAVLGVHPVHEAVLLEHADGHAAFAPLDVDSQHSVIGDFARKLARLHAADPGNLDLPALHPVRSIAEHVVEELDIWESRLDASGMPHPFLTACFAWLRANNPDVDESPVLVQGDTGPGNFLHDGAKVTAFLDFELGHIGDPMADLAWVGTRNAQEPVPDFNDFLAQYAAASGTTPDPSRLRFHALFAELRIAVLGAGRVDDGGALMSDLGAQLIYGALHYRLTVEALAAATDQPLPDIALLEAKDTAQTRYFDGALLQMKDIIGPHVGDAFAARRLKNMARVLKYLREVDRVDTTPDDAELGDLQGLLGDRPTSVEEGRGRLDDLVRSGQCSAVDLIGYAAGRAGRSHQLLAPAMGALSTRHLPQF